MSCRFSTKPGIEISIWDLSESIALFHLLMTALNFDKRMAVDNRRSMAVCMTGPAAGCPH